MTDDPMRCDDLVELVTEYFEESLDADRRTRFEDHLAECDGCTGYLDQLRISIAATGAIRDDDLDPSFRERLLNAFRDWP